MGKNNKSKRGTAPQKNATVATHCESLVNRLPSRQLRISVARKLFLAAYEKTYGNIAASCEFAGIHRSTFYRWLRSNSAINRKFRKRFESVNPKELQKDFIEAKFMQLIAEGVPSAVIYGLRTLCADRGFSDRERRPEISDQLTEKAKNLKLLIEQNAQQKGVSYKNELQNVLDNYRYIFRSEVIEKLIQL